MKLARIVLIAVVVATLLVPAAGASGPSAVIGKFYCHLGPGASGLPMTLVTSVKTQQVVSASGLVRLTCHFSIPYGGPAKAVHYSGFDCRTTEGTTYNSRSVITRYNAHLVCLIKP